MVSHFLLVVLVASILHVSYATTAYDVLEKNNLPRGLLPNGVKSYILKQQQQQHSLFSQASWGRLEMKPERNKFKVQAH